VPEIIHQFADAASGSKLPAKFREFPIHPTVLPQIQSKDREALSEASLRCVLRLRCIKASLY
jgi:hypothetical protein